MNVHEHWQAGRLDQALQAATEDVKLRPSDPNARGLLAELLCFAGELERADKQLDAMGRVAPDAMLGISLFRQLIHAQQARAQWFQEGRLPELLGKPSPRIELHLEAAIAAREGRQQEAGRLLDQAESMRPRVSGTCDGQPFDDFRDLDDLTASLWEVLTSNGKYYWIPMEQVESIEFRPPERPRDLLWRRAHMIVRDGPDGEVYLPAIYAGSQAETDDQLRLGRATDWRGGRDGSPVRGFGQRMFLVQGEGREMLSLGTIQVNPPSGSVNDEPNPT